VRTATGFIAVIIAALVVGSMQACDATSPGNDTTITAGIDTLAFSVSGPAVTMIGADATFSADDPTSSSPSMEWSVSPRGAAAVELTGPVTATIHTRQPGPLTIVAHRGTRGGIAHMLITEAPPVEAVRVSGAQHWKAVASGYRHSCALDDAGQAWCWGDSGNGVASRVPTLVATTERFVSIVAGFNHTCALTAEGQAYCWGANSLGELGRGQNTGSFSNTPAPVASDVRFTQLAAGADHVCGLTALRATWCWGLNEYAQSGPRQETCVIPFEGAYYCNSTPKPISSGAYVAIAAGTSGTCGLTPGGEVQCWGTVLLGAAATSTCQKAAHAGPAEFPCNQLPTRVDVTGATSVVSSSLSSQACARAASKWYCWRNDTPVVVEQAVTLTQLVPAGSDEVGFRCGLNANGNAFCWGVVNQFGPPGDVVTQTLVPILGTDPLMQLAPGGLHVCAVASNGAAYCWGRSTEGQLGSG